MPKPRPLQPNEAKSSLANRLAPRVDRLRQFSTKLGVRPLRVFLVYERYTGADYGVGNRVEVARAEILPTPKVEQFDGQRFVLLHPGMVQEGAVRVSKISARYTFDELRGLQVPERHEDQLPRPYEFHYEIYEDGRGDQNPVRFRYRLSGVPTRNAGKVEWVVGLEKVSGDDDRFGKSPY